MEATKERLHLLEKRYRKALADLTKARADIEQVRFRMGNNLAAESIARLVNAHSTEARSNERYRDAQREYLSFLQCIQAQQLVIRRIAVIN